jgi:hypothetical protein
VGALVPRCFVGKEKPLQQEKRDATSEFDRTDYSVVVKNRGTNPWKWEIYRAGKSSPIKQSPVNFSTMAMARWRAVLPGPSKPVRHVHGLVRKTASLIDLAGHVHDRSGTTHDGEG